jgi:hypothetical protein
VTARRIVNCCEVTERLEQRYCIKFCQKPGDTQVKTIRKIQQAFGDDGMSNIHGGLVLYVSFGLRGLKIKKKNGDAFEQ